MALIKEIMTDVGLPATFWLIAKLDIDKVAEQGLITLYGYLNKEHCDANQGYLTRMFINVYPKDFYNVFSLDNLNQDNPYKLAYEYLKTTEQFKDAKDAIFDQNGESIED